jgi:hypothetical protein
MEGSPASAGPSFVLGDLTLPPLPRDNEMRGPRCGNSGARLRQWQRETSPTRSVRQKARSRAIVFVHTVVRHCPRLGL